MKRTVILIVATLVFIMAQGQTKMYISAGNKSLTATLVDNEATCKLVSIMKNGAVKIEMEDYGGFEKVGSLPQSLPTSNTQITTAPGDIMLYQGRNMVIFYGTNSWSYTRLGKIDGATVSGMKEFFGSGSVSVTLSLNPTSAITDIRSDEAKEDIVYDLKGNRVTGSPLAPGIYIVNGKKTLITR